MKTLTLRYTETGDVFTWKASYEPANGGWLVTNHEGDKKFLGGNWFAVLDHMKQITFPNWGVRLLGVR